MEKGIMNKKNKRGFTLVELIVVLVILAILASLLIPALTGYVTKAKKAGGHHRSTGCVDGFAGCADRMLRPVPGKL